MAAKHLQTSGSKLDKKILTLHTLLAMQAQKLCRGSIAMEVS